MYSRYRYRHSIVVPVKIVRLRPGPSLLLEVNAEFVVLWRFVWKKYDVGRLRESECSFVGII